MRDFWIEFVRDLLAAKVKPSVRYAKGIASYGKKVRTDKRKVRIIAELNAMGVKPRVRRKMGKSKPVVFYDYARLRSSYPHLFGDWR